jgi:DNA-binding NarL/FixJ family response regulator
MIKKKRIIVALSCSISTNGLADWVRARPWLRLAAVCRNEDMLVRAANANTEAVLATDAKMGEQTIVPLLAELYRANPGLSIIGLLDDPEGPLAAQMMRAGAIGLVAKSDMDGWQEALLKAFRGELAMRGDMALRLMRQAFKQSRGGGLESLTARELEVYKGFTAKECGKDASSRLGISTKTVCAHRESIKRKLGCSSLKEVRSLASTMGAQG